MCLILFAYRLHPDYPLVLAANRDEFFARPTEPLHQWPDAPGLFAGRDTRAGGTWMGVSDRGRFAAVTNFRQPGGKEGPRSRGELVSRFLLGNQTPTEFVAHELERPDDFAGFNLLLADQDGLHYVSNRNGRSTAQVLQPGLYGLSNHLLDTPWPKVRRGKARLFAALQGSAADYDENLWHLLADTEPAADHELPNTGIERAWEKILSAAFIRTADYGTRCSTVLRVTASGRVTLREKTFPAPGTADYTAPAQIDITLPPGSRAPLAVAASRGSGT